MANTAKRVEANVKAALPSWDRVAGNWKQFAGKARERWGELTDDDLSWIDGRREQLVGKIQERYGIIADQAER
ncbi:CsbD family protein, partial [Ferrovibrio sp.]|uniref:CsbD family protein n=1 Tax=Ferrovibrio sp. TaxID=1917215 RepID=UPI0026091625